MSAPSPSTYTLLLKSHRTTVLLSALPSLPLSKLKSALYSALQESSPHHITSPLPPSPDSIVLGLPRDPNDWNKGWYPIGDDADLEIDEFEVIGSRGGSDDDEGDLEGNDDDDDDDEDDEDDVRGKGKKKSTSKGKKKGGSGNKKSGWTVEKAGLKDGAVVAYYVKDTQGRSTSSAKGTKPKGFVVERPLDEDEEGEWDEEEDAKMVE